MSARAPRPWRRGAAESFFDEAFSPIARARVPEAWLPATEDVPSTVRHMHERRMCTDGQTWTTASASEMSPATMNPGFLKPDDLIEFDLRLDKKLVDLIVDNTDYRAMVSAEAASKRYPSEADKLRVALVDLTGKSKTAAVTQALTEFIARREQARLLELFGSLAWDPDFDYKRERTRR